MDLSVLPAVFYDTTFTLHRLSPLHSSPTSPLLSETRLQAHARRFHDSLKGDIRRGVTIELDDKAANAKSGLLKQSRWSLLRRIRDQSVTEGQLPGMGMDAAEIIWGIHMEVEYEKATYVAFMLRRDGLQQSGDGGEVYLPLLLTHMPTSVRDLLIDYVTTTFDSRVEAMRLSSNFLAQSVDGFLETASEDGPGELEKVAKDVHISFGFKPPVAPSLRNLDIVIQREDLPSFVSRGKRLEKRKEHDLNVQETKRRKGNRLEVKGPFMTALSDYMQTHLAMNLGHGEIYLSKVACGGFSLSRDGKARTQSSAASIESIGLESHEINLGQKATARLITELVLASQLGSSNA